MQNINQIISAYPDEYVAIKKQAKKYLLNNSIIDTNETVAILHRPWIAPLNWGLMLYRGVDSMFINEVEDLIQKSNPGILQRFFRANQRMFLYDISLFGFVRSFTRLHLQCYDLVTANNSWINEYAIDQAYFHFGGGVDSYDENTGYFYGKNKIFSIRKNGKVVNEWTDFTDFLNDELNKAEKEMLKEIPENVKLIISE